MGRRARKTQHHQEPSSEHFTKSTTLPGWTCNLCTSGSSRPLVMSARQALHHEKMPDHKRAVANQDSWNHPVSGDDWIDSAPALAGLKELHELDRREWVDMGPEVIGFWRDGVQAAERGEEPERLQSFLERLEEERAARRRNDDDWGLNAIGGLRADAEHGYGAGDWGDWSSPSPQQPQNNAQIYADMWLKSDADPWGEVPAQDSWAAQPTWDDWFQTSDTLHKPVRSQRNAGHRGQVWRHPQDSQDSMCSNEQASRELQHLSDFAEDFAARNHVAPARKNRLERFAKMSSEERIQEIRENITQLRQPTRV